MSPPAELSVTGPMFSGTLVARWVILCDTCHGLRASGQVESVLRLVGHHFTWTRGMVKPRTELPDWILLSVSRGRTLVTGNACAQLCAERAMPRMLDALLEAWREERRQAGSNEASPEPLTIVRLDTARE